MLQQLGYGTFIISVLLSVYTFYQHPALNFGGVPASCMPPIGDVCRHLSGASLVDLFHAVFFVPHCLLVDFNTYCFGETNTVGIVLGGYLVYVLICSI